MDRRDHGYHLKVKSVQVIAEQNKIANLEYAGDVVLFGDSYELQQMLYYVWIVQQKFGSV